VYEPPLVITGIIDHPKKPLAIINGEVVEQGQTISLSNDSKVFIKRITKEGVEVSYMGTSFNFKLEKQQ